MNFKLTDEQQAMVDALQAILADHSTLAQADRHGFHHHDARLQELLEANGFLDACRDLGSLEAALVVMECARVPACLDLGASVLVAANVLPEGRPTGGVALVADGGLSRAIRNLPLARTLLAVDGDDVVVLPVDPAAVVPVQSIYAFPYGRLRSPPALHLARRLPGAAAGMRHWWRLAIAAECAGAAQSAIEFTLEHVKQRNVLGRPVGSFQAVQHRLVQCHMLATSTRFLALRAAWSGEAAHVDAAACHAQASIKKWVEDLHQFNGAMGVTLEHLLHFWTYRLRALQPEAGGTTGAALDIARARWA